jgi:biotin carboxyl carrier protein
VALSVASGAILQLIDEVVTPGSTIDDQGTVLITTTVPSGGTVFNNVVVDDDAVVNHTTSGGLAGIVVAAGATLTLEGGTLIEGGTHADLGRAGDHQLSGALIASGSVVVDSNVKKVQHPTGGVVGELRVRDGDRVKAGDVIARLDQTVTRANLAVITKGLDEFAARKARWRANGMRRR